MAWPYPYHRLLYSSPIMLNNQLPINNYHIDFINFYHITVYYTKHKLIIRGIILWTVKLELD